ncbi:MAG: galactose-1-phosphate uridylyltransferase [candidate division Zixibacteria bacterium]|nr:galactose-1-phosphate uridylyltransferase [candidate division Zixibacteria bacterium]MCI0597158.1 galactose-1-phosphate uridylyltransferase [candidate division Zixibacteria bacterium]
MPELRKDPVSGRWVIISTERGKRPSDFPPTPKRAGDPKKCPFCPGNEAQTPPEITAYRSDGGRPNTSGWKLRVIPNKFPALKIEGNLNREGKGIYDQMNGVGAHEVIIETPDHHKELADLEVQQVQDVLWAYRERILDLKKDPRFRYIMVFKNQGDAAGASLEHSHSQLIATPVVPKRVLDELEGAEKYYEYKERCVFCDILRQELEDRARVVAENKEFAAIEPFAPRFPFETWIMPKLHNDLFENHDKESFPAMAQILRDVLRRLAKSLSEPPYNYMVHTGPVGNHHEALYHWHIEIIPKLTKVAGFEWGTGFYINPTSPEDAARFLNETPSD